MRLITSERETYVLELSKEEFHQIINTVESVEQYFDDIDPNMLNMSFDQITALREKLYVILERPTGDRL